MSFWLPVWHSRHHRERHRRPESFTSLSSKPALSLKAKGPPFRTAPFKFCSALTPAEEVAAVIERPGLDGERGDDVERGALAVVKQQRALAEVHPRANQETVVGNR